MTSLAGPSGSTLREQLIGLSELFDSVLCALDHVPLVVETERTVGGHLLERLNVLFLSKERRGLAAIRGAHLSPDRFVGVHDVLHLCPAPRQAQAIINTEQAKPLM